MARSGFPEGAAIGNIHDANARCSAMNDEALNVTTRQFLKRFGITAQREIERAVRAGIEDGTLGGRETIPVRATLTMPGVLQEIEISGEIALE
jgi:hypothetical protein